MERAPSELSNGVQLADLQACNLYHAFSYENFTYKYFQQVLPNFGRRKDGGKIDGLKVWPDDSPLIEFAAKELKSFQIF